MKNEKGITLMTIIIYVIAVFALLGTISVLTNFFHKNVQVVTSESILEAEYNKFNMQFLDDIKKEGNKIQTINSNYISFSNGSVYTISNNKIYRNSVAIAEYAETLVFKKSVVGNDITIIEVIIEFENKNGAMTKTEKYTLSN